MPMAVSMTMIMLDELRLVGMRVTAALNGDRDLESMGLRDLLDGFPILAPARKPEHLPRARGAQRLDRDRFRRHPGETEAGRHARLEDRQFQQTVAGRDTLQLGSMHVIVVVMTAVPFGMREIVTMDVPMPAARAQFAPRRDRDPAAKGDKRDA